jgi:hypothetical protein
MIFPLSAKNRFMQIGGRGHFVRWRQAAYRIDAAARSMTAGAPETK